MAITLDGTNGGTASAGWYAQAPFTGTYADGIVVDYTTGIGRVSVGTADGVAFYNGGVANTELMRLDSSGNLGLGVTPSAWIGAKAIQIGSAGSHIAALTSNAIPDLYLGTNCYYDNGTWRYVASGGYRATRYQMSDLGQHQWFVENNGGTPGNAISFTQAMTLDASGNLLVGTTSNIGAGYKCVLSNNGTNLWGFGPYVGASSNFYVSNNANTGVYLAYGNTSWTANSDERLKTDLRPIEDAIQKISTLRAVTGRYIADEEGISRSFLIAQDVQAVLPEAVDTSDPDRLGVQYTDTIPLLVAAIKELTARLEALEAKA